MKQLLEVPRDRGIEIDIRDYDGELRLVHDPFLGGETLEKFLNAYDHALAIFNTKCDGIEGRIEELAQRYQVSDYFFLDLANPTLVRLAREGNHNIAVRFSEFEPVEFALAFAGQARWVWVDCFTQLPLDRGTYEQLRKHFQICLVSPELQGHPRESIREYRRLLSGMPIDAVCSDFCDDWMR
ncbi:MAG: hypothetical protein P1S46_05355 [bacterium]|nr:hypothetical protein [bacterium]